METDACKLMVAGLHNANQPEELSMFGRLVEIEIYGRGKTKKLYGHV